MKTIHDIVAEVWPDWKLESVIGAGTYGEVYRAVREDAAGKYTAAIKVVKTYPLNSHILCTDGQETGKEFERMVARFSREIRVMQSLKGQSNLVSIDDYRIQEDQESGIWYFLIRMELLTPLLVDMDIREYTEENVIRLGMDLCRGLEVCESRQVIHRDIKPENIFVNSLGNYKLGDFGVARTLEITRESLTGLEFAQWERFVAPEVKTGSLSDAGFEEAHRADIYSLGMVMYWIANGRTFPFLKRKQLHTSRERSEAESRRLKGEELPPPEGISPELARVIQKACAFRNEDRYENAAAFRKALEKVGSVKAPEGSLEQAPRRKAAKRSAARGWKWAMAVLCLAVLCAGGWLLLRPGMPETESRKASGSLPPESKEADTLILHEVEYPHVYHIGEEMTAGGLVMSDADLNALTLNLYTPENTWKQQVTFDSGIRQYDMRELGDALFRNLEEGRFWLEMIVTDTAGRTVGFSHDCTASRSAKGHTLYPMNRSCRPPELKGSLVYGGHTYEVYYLSGGGWDYSRAFAEGRGGHLVTFSDAEEFNVITGYVQGMGCKWLSTGAQYRDGTWSWVDGTPFEFVRWSPTTPEDEALPYDPTGAMVYVNRQWYYGKATQYEMSFFVAEYDDVLR